MLVEAALAGLEPLAPAPEQAASGYWAAVGAAAAEAERVVAVTASE